jgi:hypothetical protein
MKYAIKDLPLLRKILWLDAFLGGLTAVVGLCFSSVLTDVSGLTTRFILIVSAITLCYSAVAGILASQNTTSIPLLRLLIKANWIWTIISVGLLFVHVRAAQPVGKAFLVLQILVVGALAYLEGKQLIRSFTR